MSKETKIKWSATTKEKQIIDDLKSWPTISGSEPADQISSVPEEKLLNDNVKIFIQNQSREEILDDRKQRRAEMNDKKLQDAFKNLNLVQKSQQIKIIDHKLLEKYLGAQQKSESSLDDRMRHNKKFRKLHTDAFNFFDFTKPVTAQVIKTVKKPPAKKIGLNIRYKRRENPKKKLSRLKKNILMIRAARRNTPVQENDDNSIKDTPALNTQEINVLEKESNVFSYTDEKSIIKSPEVPPDNSTVIRHSRNFRPYCNQFINNEIREISKAFLTKIFK